MSNNRRDFFKTLGTAAAGVAAAGPLIAPSANAAVGGTKGESPTFIYALAFDQSIAGLIREFDGGGAFAEVIREPMDEFGVFLKGRFLLKMPREWRAMSQFPEREPEQTPKK